MFSNGHYPTAPTLNILKSYQVDDIITALREEVYSDVIIVIIWERGVGPCYGSDIIKDLILKATALRH